MASFHLCLKMFTEGQKNIKIFKEGHRQVTNQTRKFLILVKLKLSPTPVPAKSFSHPPILTDTLFGSESRHIGPN